MSHAHTSHGHGGGGLVPHVLRLRIYIGVWAALLVLTVVTVAVSYQDFGTLNIVVAMAVATVKATLVTLFFMHLKYDEHFNVIVFVTSLTFLGIFFILTMADTAERGKVDPIEASVIEPVPAFAVLDSTGHGAVADSVHGAPARGMPADSTQAPGTH
jgi:cytochrome c oxidase subunit 4